MNEALCIQRQYELLLVTSVITSQRGGEVKGQLLMKVRRGALNLDLIGQLF